MTALAAYHLIFVIRGIPVVVGEIVMTAYVHPYELDQLAVIGDVQAGVGKAYRNPAIG